MQFRAASLSHESACHLVRRKCVCGHAAREPFKEKQSHISLPPLPPPSWIVEQQESSLFILPLFSVWKVNEYVHYKRGGRQGRQGAQGNLSHMWNSRPAFDRLAGKYAFQGGRSLIPFWMDGRSREIPVAQEMEVPAARIESISSFFAPSPFLRPKTPSLFFSEQSRRSKLRLNLNNFHKKGTKRDLGFWYPLNEICIASQKRRLLSFPGGEKHWTQTGPKQKSLRS